MDKNFRSLNCGMSVLDPTGDEYKMVSKYLQNSHGKTHGSYGLELLDVFCMDKKAAHAPGDNRMLLWHGSRLSNWVGILSQGLRIAPPEAPCTGYM